MFNIFINMFNRYNYSTLIQKILRENKQTNNDFNELQDISNNEDTSNNEDISNDEYISNNQNISNNEYTVTACFKSIENENIYIFDDELLENIKKISKYIKNFENIINYINNIFSYFTNKLRIY